MMKTKVGGAVGDLEAGTGRGRMLARDFIAVLGQGGGVRMDFMNLWILKLVFSEVNATVNELHRVF